MSKAKAELQKREGFLGESERVGKAACWGGEGVVRPIMGRSEHV